MEERILWVMNSPVSIMNQKLGVKQNNKEGWLTGIFGAVIRANRNSTRKIRLAVCAPYRGDELYHFQTEEAEFYGFPEDMIHPESYDIRLHDSFVQIYQEFRPTLVHLFGTEYAHSTEAAKCAQGLCPVIAGIQGVMKACTDAYMCFLPEKIQKKKTFRDILKHDSLLEQQNKFNKRAAFEKETLTHIGHVAGRTDFDKASVLKINPSLKYHYLDEIMREPFYTGEWNLNQCSTHRIFLSQGNYPLKGAHLAIEALSIIQRKYPDAKLIIAGDNITKYDTIREKIAIGGYGNYLRKLIRDLYLQMDVSFTGSITAERMKEEYLSSHLFLCPCSVENSPNSVIEAMLLGVPVVASRTGGIMDVIEPETEGLFFTPGKIEELSDAVCSVFEDTEAACIRANRSKIHALNAHAPEKVLMQLQIAYSECLGREFVL